MSAASHLLSAAADNIDDILTVVNDIRLTLRHSTNTTNVGR